ncbi:MAG: acyl-CoA thioesterase [Clostridia bacterium]|nr:acyl-CoA thioesterase [Clostridia bacterium]
MFSNTAEIKVRYQETDMMGVVYHANYLVWFEVGRTELFEKVYPYARLESEGAMLPVVECSCKFKSPARYGEVVEINASFEELKSASLTIYYEVRRKEDQELLVTGMTKHAFVNKELKPIKVRKDLPEFWEAITAVKETE